MNMTYSPFPWRLSRSDRYPDRPAWTRSSRFSRRFRSPAPAWTHPARSCSHTTRPSRCYKTIRAIDDPWRGAIWAIPRLPDRSTTSRSSPLRWAKTSRIWRRRLFRPDKTSPGDPWRFPIDVGRVQIFTALEISPPASTRRIDVRKKSSFA